MSTHNSLVCRARNWEPSAHAPMKKTAYHVPTMKCRTAAKRYKGQLHVFTRMKGADIRQGKTKASYRKKNIQFDIIYTMLSDMQKSQA